MHNRTKHRDGDQASERGSLADGWCWDDDDNNPIARVKVLVGDDRRGGEGAADKVSPGTKTADHTNGYRSLAGGRGRGMSDIG